MPGFITSLAQGNCAIFGIDGATMFGKSPADYIRFEKSILILIAVVYVFRLGMSLAGLSVEQTRWVSINIVLLVGLIYASVAVQTSGFGGYKQLLILLFFQAALAHILISLGIVLGIVAGKDNIFTVPEVFGGQDGKTWLHAFLHFAIAPILFPVIGWLPGSVILFVTRRVRPAASMTL